APVVGGHVEEVRLLGINRTRLLVFAAHSRGASLDVAATLQRRMLAHLHRTTRLHVDLLGPVRRHVFRGAEQSAVSTVEHVSKAVTVEVGKSLPLLAVDIHVGQHVLVDAVIVPLIERRHLVCEDCRAVLDLAAENGHRPLVVETTSVALLMGLVRAAIGRAPQTGVTGRVVDHLQLGVISVPVPSRAAADLVVLAREGRDTEIGTSLTELRGGLVGVGTDAHGLVGTRAVALPNLRAILQRVGRHTTASSELVATEADDNLVVSNQRSGGDRLALFRPSMLHDPELLAGSAVEGNHEAIEGAIDELAVGKGTATVHGVAASARHSRLVTVGLLDVVPDFFRVVRISQIQSLHHVTVRHGWATADHEQHGLAADILNHEGLTLMATEGVGALQPGHLQLADILRVDVGPRAVASHSEVTARGRPLVRVLHSCKLLLIGASKSLSGNAHHQRDEPPGYKTKLQIVHFFLLSLATQFTEAELFWYARPTGPECLDEDVRTLASLHIVKVDMGGCPKA